MKWAETSKMAQVFVAQRIDENVVKRKDKENNQKRTRQSACQLCDFRKLVNITDVAYFKISILSTKSQGFCEE